MTLIKESVMYVNVLEYFRNMSLFNDQDANCRIKRPIAKSKWKHASTAIVSRLWTFIIVFYFYFSFSLFAFGLRIICFLFLQYDVFLWLCANWVQKTIIWNWFIVFLLSFQFTVLNDGTYLNSILGEDRWTTTSDITTDTIVAVPANNLITTCHHSLA